MTNQRIRETYLCVWCPMMHRFDSIVHCGSCKHCDIMASTFHGKCEIACNYLESLPSRKPTHPVKPSQPENNSAEARLGDLKTGQ